ncbi:hypothetical protein EWM64_g548 [Hericium alpestre]|uniref:Cytochrome P450 n=1 Tax=Hericium alpestre TaxID=135208 RepID=A0A4Z0AAU5_9AGAM|nr:hypothetical protein EWM64_g548 [Hericium alpestre]
MFAAAVLFAFALVVALVARWLKARRLRLPPGPPPDPFIGNLRQMAFTNQEQMFESWGKTYVWAGTRFSATCPTASVPEHRRLIQDHFNQQAILAYRPLQRLETCTLLLGLLQKPEAFIRHVRRFSAGTIMKITYGHTVKSMDELYVRLAEDAAHETVSAGSPGSMLVDFFPALKFLPAWMPGAGFKRHALKTRVKVRRMLDIPFKMVQRTMAAGTAIPSFVSDLIIANESDSKHKQYEEEDIKGAAGVLYGAATDTTSALLISFFLAMTLHPDVLRKAQAEIEEKVGPDRLPDFEDRDSLPYVDSIVKEVYRAMTRSEDMYTDPHTFYPERFMNQDSQTAEMTDPKNVVFGFGRRLCPGKFFGDANIWLVVASVLAAFDITKRRNDRGEEIPPLVDYASGFVSNEAAQVPKLDVSNEGLASMKYDAMGPLVVNSDGTVSRITNWPNMTELERERTMKVLIARNKLRLAKQDADDPSSTPLSMAGSAGEASK